jgi:hypothetical protein
MQILYRHASRKLVYGYNEMRVQKGITDASSILEGRCLNLIHGGIAAIEFDQLTMVPLLQDLGVLHISKVIQCSNMEICKNMTHNMRSACLVRFPKRWEEKIIVFERLRASQFAETLEEV